MYSILIFLSCLTISTYVNGMNIINLKDDNFITIRGKVTSNNIGYAINQLMKITKYNSHVYLYLDTPGGDVMAGLYLINYMKALQENRIKIDCVVNTAISMGFVILQQCSTRYVLPHSTLMQHQMSLENGPFGEIEKINSYVKYLNSLENDLNILQSNKINMKLEKFQEKILTDWWMTSQEAIENNVVDNYAVFYCDFQNYNETIDGVEYSRCPLLP